MNSRLHDTRGSFSRWYCSKQMNSLIDNLPIRQINHSINIHSGTVRGLHYQLGPQLEYKIIRCIKGEVLDAVVDLRRNSRTFLQVVQVMLSATKNNALVVPPGCAHGFQCIEDNSQLMYLHTSEYFPEFEGGVNVNDPALNITWPLPIKDQSERDSAFPFLTDNFSGILL
ncbi:dTDP-4-dehydrorhamnose 3,5-epimerase family protein [Alteromonas gracilis]|uniref:dTDP-4-dehydrorhamnose 3,5-epimerase family protein n=1 Tax=Alteromonas gracilis TaxID=1479524 RepID=UPI00321B5B2B